MPRSAPHTTLPSPVDGSVVLRDAKSPRALPWLLLALGFLLVVGIHWGSLRGQFLSDDFGFPWGLSLAAQHDAVWRYVWDAVIVREPQPGNFYRPVGFLSFAFNWWLGGAAPLGWRLFNLVVHLLDGWLVYRLARRLLGVQHLTFFAAALAAALFWLYPLAPEVSAWVCARFDALAVAGLLLCLERHLASRRLLDSAQIASLFALAFALGSKESAMTAPAFLLLLDLFCPPAPMSGFDRARRAVWRLLPVLGLFVAYLLWRRYLFGGNAVEVYANSSPLMHLSPIELMHRLRSMTPILRQSFGSVLIPLAAIITVALAFGGIVAWRAGRFAKLWLLPALGCAISVGAVLPHFTGSPENGEGARLFYLAAIWLALWLAMPLAALRRDVLRSAIAVTLILAFAGAQARAMVPWRKAAQAMRGLITAVAHDTPALRDAHAHGLVLVPDHWRTAPFARNAQLAPVIAPFQPADYRDTLGIFTPFGHAEWAQRVRDHALPWHSEATEMPRYFCFDADRSALVPLTLPPDAAQSTEAWRVAWNQAIAASPCADDFPE